MSEILLIFLNGPILSGFSLSENEHGENFFLIQKYRCLRVLDSCMFY